MKRILYTVLVAISILLGSCYVEETIVDPSGVPTVVAPPPVYYWTYPRYGTPYYSPNFYRPAPRPPYRVTPPPPHHKPNVTPPTHRPNNSGNHRPERPRPNVTPRPSSPNPPPPRPPRPGNHSRPNHKVTYGHR